MQRPLSPDQRLRKARASMMMLVCGRWLRAHAPLPVFVVFFIPVTAGLGVLGLNAISSLCAAGCNFVHDLLDPPATLKVDHLENDTLPGHAMQPRILSWAVFGGIGPGLSGVRQQRGRSRPL